jgi:SAM-dependent methyltransferase
MTYRLYDSFKTNDWAHNPENIKDIFDWFDHRPEGFEMWIANNSIRDRFVEPVIEAKVKNKVVIDLGCGSGYYGVMSLLLGCEYAYFVDICAQTTAIVQRGLDKMHEAGLIKNNYQVIHSDIESLTREHFQGPEAQVVLSEFFGPLVFDEGFQPYTEHLDTIFKNLDFMPNRLSVRISTWEADFTKSPWPHANPHLIEMYKAYFANKPFLNKLSFFGDNIGTVDCKGLDLLHHGEIFYDANDKSVNEEVDIIITEPSQMLGVFNCLLGGIDGTWFSNAPKYGWWIDEPGHYKIIIDVKHSKRMPVLIKVDD